MKGPFETNIFDHCTGCEWESEAVDSRVYCADSICKASTRRESRRQYGNAGKVYEAYSQVREAKDAETKPPLSNAAPISIRSCIPSFRARIMMVGAASMATAKLRPPIRAQSTDLGP